MQPLTRHVGRAIALRRSNVDTDQIVPAEYCKRVTKSGFEDALFARWRAEPGFVLNRSEAAGCTVLLAGPNFGTGSSREHAVWALRDWGFRAVIADGFGDIFSRNALRNGLLAVSLPDAVVAGLMSTADGDGLRVCVDLERTTVSAGADEWDFDIDEKARRLLLDGLDDIEVTLGHEDAITAHERHRSYWLPVVEAVP